MGCAIDECGSPAKRRGWCNKHYMRWWKHGDPLYVTRKVTRGSLEDRLWANVDRTGKHWMWTGKSVTDFGYGVLSRGRRDEGRVLAHVAAWEVTYGPVPDGMHVLHRCDIPACCRPACLFLGTLADNNHDMIAKGRHWAQLQPVTHCPQGHEYTPANTMTQGGRGTGKRCRICHNTNNRDRRARERAARLAA